MKHEDIKKVTELIEDYFRGIYEGDVSLLRQVFEPGIVLFGHVNGEPYEKDLESYLSGVANRQSPKELGEPYTMQITGIELMGSIGLVRASVPMLGFHYHDLLGVVRREGQWKIVHKAFANLPA
ncbi:MAG: nuclear transport factor 2 family protein [Roseivirga sp.]|nr:nuclear transport factor 2 family protein [Roseivirga sp.]